MKLSGLRMRTSSATAGITPMLIGAFFLVVPACFLFYPFSRPDSTTAASLADAYATAVFESQHVGQAPTSAEIVLINPDQPLTVVTCMPHKYISLYQASKPLSRDVWATVAPFLKHFCRDFEKSNGSDPMKLGVRLKQHPTSLEKAAGIAIKTLRCAHGGEGVSQSELGRAIGVRAGTISRWERGLCTPNLDNFRSLATFLGVPIRRLLDTQKDSASEPLADCNALEALGEWRPEEMVRFALFRGTDRIKTG